MKPLATAPPGTFDVRVGELTFAAAPGLNRAVIEAINTEFERRVAGFVQQYNALWSLFCAAARDTPRESLWRGAAEGEFSSPNGLPSWAQVHLPLMSLQPDPLILDEEFVLGHVYCGLAFDMGMRDGYYQKQLFLLDQALSQGEVSPSIRQLAVALGLDRCIVEGDETKVASKLSNLLAMVFPFTTPHRQSANPQTPPNLTTMAGPLVFDSLAGWDEVERVAERAAQARARAARPPAKKKP